MTVDAENLHVIVRSGLNGQAPRCDHLDQPRVVEYGVAECKECLTLGWTWTRLLACLTCGWVACSDDSAGRHARAHYEETDHPVVAALDEDSSWRWCYVHKRTV
ncbi:UBP-type zinc finger domain-containing protein [Streptosporangiaceae bacterium NEAU-GS5]|nr:UBP-type zinc finger domain-containing protein [Streptosporangiaceae bacterium NEAU-GS5]